MKFRVRNTIAIAAAVLTALLLPVTAAAACTEHQMDGGVITTQPTCDTIGIITYTCQNEGCSYSYTEKLGNLGHRYEDGVCTVCGAVDESYVPPEDGAAASTPVSTAAVQRPQSSAVSKEPAASAATTPAVYAAPPVQPAAAPRNTDVLPLAVLVVTLASGTAAILLARRLVRQS